MFLAYLDCYSLHPIEYGYKHKITYHDCKMRSHSSSSLDRLVKATNPICNSEVVEQAVLKKTIEGKGREEKMI